MKKGKKPEQFIKTPGYPGGREAMNNFIRENLRYPTEALKNEVEGSVVIRFDINNQGTVTKAIIEKGIGHGCDEEALRVVRLLKFQPVKQRGYRAAYTKTLTIRFKLPNNTKATQINYQLVEKPAERKDGGPTYTYTINIE